jgi:hypothetical protein
MGIKYDTSILDLYKVISPILPFIKKIIFCGGIGDPIFHPHFVEFIKFCRTHYLNLLIEIHTNGSILNEEWKELGELSSDKIEIVFGIDGLAANHYKYRGTDYFTVIRNLKTYIDNGGNAIWQTILFNFNHDIIDQIIQVSKNIGCKQFRLLRSDIYLSDGELSSPGKIVSRDILLQNLKRDKVNCYWKDRNNIYIDEYGKIHPCCHMTPFLDVDIFDDIRPLYLKNVDNIDLMKTSFELAIKSDYFSYIYKNASRIKRCLHLCSKNPKLNNFIRPIKVVTHK